VCTRRWWIVCLPGQGVSIVFNMERVAGIGGYFFRANDPEALAAWYEVNLGISSMATGGSWEQEAGPTVFAPFPADTEYFGRRDQQSMLNFRVANLDAMLTQLRVAGASVEDETSEASYGRFGHAVDPEGNRFELWEPSEIPTPDM
jgi:catechol 2,3-dioxygenase-like lactoylglutathione lyase family enzyme